MSDNQPLTRKSRRRLDPAERDRLIAEIAEASSIDETVTHLRQLVGVPHVTADEEAAAEIEAENAALVPESPDALWTTDAFDDEADSLLDDEEAEPAFDYAEEPRHAPAHPTAPDAIGDVFPAESGLDMSREMAEPAAEPETPAEIETPAAPEHEPQSIAEAEPAPEPQAVAEDMPSPFDEDTPMPGHGWDRLASIPVDARHLERNLIITASRHDPAHGAFDVLRTRLVQTLLENNWRRVAITSPTRDCGKTFTATNLAISLSRYENNRTMLMDMDMRNPSLANVLGASDVGSMGDFLQGSVPVTDHFKRLGRNALNIGSNLAVAMNDRVEPYAAELLQDPMTASVLERMMDELDPDIVLYDLPPALAFDDVIAFKGQFDGVLMVVGGGLTRAEEVREVMRRLGDDVPLLGVVLNQAEGEDSRGYTYGY
ncbi:nucleotide-binding protein [Marimonas lutisalis]|uniref:nucleotide-binding protein n=1 Tax=Marimonas lutisalis TaxID=2545756 RepID=UPI001F3D4DE1|nr:exopolysaccharide biosynthesis protein [Marimonas lutisalis]